MFELAMLKMPFDAQNFQQLCNKIVRGPSPKLSHEFSQSLRDMCAAMLTADARKRPTAEKLLQWPVVQDEIRVMLEEERSRKENDVQVLVERFDIEPYSDFSAK